MRDGGEKVVFGPVRGLGRNPRIVLALRLIRAARDDERQQPRQHDHGERGDDNDPTQVLHRRQRLLVIEARDDTAVADRRHRTHTRNDTLALGQRHQIGADIAAAVAVGRGAMSNRRDQDRGHGGFVALRRDRHDHASRSVGQQQLALRLQTGSVDERGREITKRESGADGKLLLRRLHRIDDAAIAAADGGQSRRSGHRRRVGPFVRRDDAPRA